MSEANDIFLALLKYAEEQEVTIDGEWGACRNVRQLYNEGVMPKAIVDAREWLIGPWIKPEEDEAGD